MENVEIVRNLIENDNGLSCHAIALATGIASRSVNRILTVKLRKKCLHARWVPHKLTDLHKTNRVEAAQQISACLERRIKHRLVIVDEK